MNNTMSMNTNEATVQRPLGTRIGNALGVGFTGLFVLPVLSVLGVSLTAIGAGLPVLSILNLAGVTRIPFNILFLQITGLPQVLVAAVCGAGFFGLGRLCFAGLKRFFAFKRQVLR